MKKPKILIITQSDIHYEADHISVEKGSTCEHLISFLVDGKRVSLRADAVKKMEYYPPEEEANAD